MSIQWTFFLLAMGLLLPPPLLSSSLRKHLMKPRRKGPPTIRSLLVQWQNWADFLRAGLGAYILTELAIRITREAKDAEMKTLLLEGIVLTLALLVQVVRLKPGVQLVAPIFYLCGLTLVLGGYESGGFAVFAGWLFAVGGKNPAFQLPIMGVALGIAGYVLGLTLPLMLNCGLIFLPLVLAFLFRKELFFVASVPRSTQPSPPSEKQ